MRQKIITLLALLCAATWLSAVETPAIFSNGMVLQRNQTIAIWGHGTSGEVVTVEFAGQRTAGTADGNGDWRLTLAPMTANAIGQQLKITGKNTLRFDNVVVGDVWLCVGQSNLHWCLKNITDGPGITAKADNKQIRLFNTPVNWSRKPDFPGKGSWQECTPASAGVFSAVAFLFGQELQQKLDVPIGLIMVAWGGCRIESLMPSESFAQSPALAAAAKEFDGMKQKSDAEIRKDKQRVPAGMFNSMISPLMPYTLRGSIYYQGEDNHGDGAAYGEKLNVLLASWRKGFNHSDLPFYLVQLPPFEYGQERPEIIPEFRAVQQKFAENSKNTGFIVTTDCGDPKDIHPREKRSLAARLAALVLFREYGLGNESVMSPTMTRVSFADGKATVEFNRPNGLKTRDGAPVSHMFLAGKDLNFYPAAVEIKDDRLIASSEKVPQPAAIRLGWDKLANPNLVNRSGVPVAPFQLLPETRK